MIIQRRFGRGDGAHGFDVRRALCQVALVVSAEAARQAFCSSRSVGIAQVPLSVQEIHAEKAPDRLLPVRRPRADTVEFPPRERLMVLIAFTRVENEVLYLVLCGQLLGQVVGKVLRPGTVDAPRPAPRAVCLGARRLVVPDELSGVSRRVRHAHTQRVILPVESRQQADHAMDVVVVLDVEPEVKNDRRQRGGLFRG
jgi:hypothetical protein